MEPSHKKTLKALVLELRHLLEGYHDSNDRWHAGDLENRLASIGIRKDREPVSHEELSHLPEEDQSARQVVDAYLELRLEAGVFHPDAVSEFVRETAYTWANRLIALRCVETRELIDEVILQKDVYGGRSLEHNRLTKRQPEICSGEDDGLFAVLDKVFAEQSRHLPLLFDPNSPGVALKPSPAALKRLVALLSGTETVKGQEPATSEVFKAPDALGWAYQYWNTEEKDRVFEKVRTKKGAKIEGADIIPATQLYTEPYMVKFLVQNSLGALWLGMHPKSKLSDGWEYYVKDADRAPVEERSLNQITFLDPACGSGHFLLEAFDLFYAMYEEEGHLKEPEQICTSILENNLFGLEIDERAIQIAEAALWMKAAEKAFGFKGVPTNLVATNIHLPKGKNHLEAFLKNHPEDEPLRPALQTIFESLEHADELGSLLQIEEPVEKELKYIQAKQGDQLSWLTPQTDQDWESWKRAAIVRIRDHFEEQAQSADLSQAFFGRSAGKGLMIFDLLSRRYDAVAANPPYMGSKNLGKLLKSYVSKYYKPGKHDLYAAFILRCISLSLNGGRIGMVTQEGWMFLSTYKELRKGDGKELQGMLGGTNIETLVHLGANAFSELTGEVVRVVLFTLEKSTELSGMRIWAAKLLRVQGASNKAHNLDRLCRKTSDSQVSHPFQSDLGMLPEAPLAYWLSRAAIMLLINEDSIGEKLEVTRGVDTCNNDRFVRWFWERQALGRGWVVFLKGGGFGRWHGNDSWLLDYRDDGIRLRSSISERYDYLDGNTEWLVKTSTFGRFGWGYSLMAQGSLGVRLIEPGSVTSNSTRGIYTPSKDLAVGALLNSRLCSFLLRALSSDIKFSEGYIKQLPLMKLGTSVDPVVASCLILKKQLLASSIVDKEFDSVAFYSRELSNSNLVVASMISTYEGYLESVVLTLPQIDEGMRTSILEETGAPSGWFPLLLDFDAMPRLPGGSESLPLVEPDLVGKPERISLTRESLYGLKSRLRTLYEAGPGGRKEVEEVETGHCSEPHEEEESIAGAQIPIPPETFLEKLSQKLEIHPISVYWLLEEGIEQEGWHCIPEEIRITADRFTVTILRILGHRWPRQIEAKEPVPEWADSDGIIPLTQGAGEPSLIERVRERIAEDFEGGDVSAIEKEFTEIMGKNLDRWVETEFFKHHTSQFKKRPVAWQLQSGKYTARKKPAFACLVYYHKLDGDTFPKILTQYVVPLRQRYETELRSIESIPLDSRSDRQDKRRVELDGLIEELKAFEATLQKVASEGFSCKKQEEIAGSELLDKWCSPDGIKSPPTEKDSFLRQEQGYNPDLNDGVRVNIAPLQKAGLLAADVLLKKDVPKSITDRADWRADERRWCRDGKLPKPGWWGSPGEF